MLKFAVSAGIVHIIGPEQGFTVPGCTCVCGDSHTATHGAFGALAFGIGTSEVEHVLATSTLPQKKMKNMLIQLNGELSSSAVTSKDIVLHICGVIGTAGGTGCTIEFAGDAIRALSMEVSSVPHDFRHMPVCRPFNVLLTGTYVYFEHGY